MSGALPLKYRPTKFEHVYGNDAVINQVKPLLKREFENLPKSWLFTGESGTGKTTMVRIIKDKLGCSENNFHEYNSSSERGIDAIRAIASNSRMAALGGGIKIFMLDEAHNLTPAAQQALLKMLEDSPPNTVFMLATTNPEKLLKAIKTRCTTIVMKSCNRKVLTDLVLDIADEEGITLSKKVAMSIGNASSGSPREALKILDQVIDIENEDDALEAVKKTIGDVSSGIQLCQEFMGNCQWKALSSILTDILKDTEPEGVRRMMMGYFSKVSLSTDNRRSDIILEQVVNMRRLDTENGDIVDACKTAFSVIQEESGTGSDVPF